MSEENEVNHWKLKAVDFLLETGNLIKNSDINAFRDDTLNRMHKYAMSDGIHLIGKADVVSETIIYSSDHEVIGSYTDTTFLHTQSTDDVMYHASIQVPGRSHFLKKYSSAIYLPIDENFFSGALIFTWNETFTPPAGYTTFLTLTTTRIKGIMRLASAKFAADDVIVKFDAVFHTVSQGLIFMDDSGKEALVNEQAKRMLNIIQAGEKFSPVLVSESMKRLRERAVNKDEINVTAIALFKEPEKRIDNWLWKFADQVFSVSSAPTLSARINGRLWVFEDISNLYFANNKLQQANKEINTKNEKLEAVNTEKNDLIGIVSHDLRSPLSQIYMLSTMVAMDTNPLSDEQRSTLGLIEKVAEKGMRLIKDLLDISAIEQQRSPKKIEAINLAEVVTASIDGFNLLGGKKNITVNVVMSNNDHVALADYDYLVRILDNLVSNAIKFSHANKVVTLSLDKQEDDFVLLAVKDEGQGIREEEMKKLFGKFGRLSARPTAKESSTGLGLFIVKSLVEEMEGRIWCESMWEHGSTFFVKLPAVVKQ